MRYSTIALHLTILLCLTSLFSNVTAQKKNIDASTYDEWKKIGSIHQSYSGNWLTYEVTSLEGDGLLYLESIENGKKIEIPRGKSAKIHYEEKFIAFLIKPQHDSIRKLKLDKVKKTKFPKDTLAIYWPSTDSTVRFKNISSFKISQEGDWIAYLSSKDLRPKTTKKKKKKKKKKKTVDKIMTTGKTLFLYNPISHKRKKLHRVKDFEINKAGTLLAYSTSTKGDKDSLSIHIINLTDFSVTTLLKSQLGLKKLTFDDAGNQLIFMTSTDTNETKNYSLSYWKKGQHNSKVIIQENTKGMPTEWTVSEHFIIHFSRNGEMIFLGTNKILVQEPKDTLLREEKARVDIWHHADLKIQPEQLKRLGRDKRKSHKAVYHLTSNKFIQLASEELESVQSYNHANSTFGLGIDSRSHQKERTWAFPWKSDFYKINLLTGQKKIIKKGLQFGRSISPSGHYFVWYNGADSSWMVTDLVNQKETNMSSSIEVNFATDNNGQPALAYPNGSYGWTKLDGEEYYVVRDRFDIWYLNPNNSEKNFCLTNGDGRKKNVRYSLMRLEYDSVYFSLDRSLIKGINDSTKNESLYKTTKNQDNYNLDLLLSTQHKITYLQKAKKSNTVLMRKMNFTTYPDLESTDLSFTSPKTLTNVNPQQKDYNWGTVEFTEWNAYDSTQLRGLLYKPEDFDPNKKYPMIVYFYEMYQDNVHFYYSPKPTASIIYPTEYISNGYIVFIPDVRYEPGHPAKSAFNCIVSGTDYLVDKYDWIDSNRLALQGQSWGGYQTAQLVTMTRKYKVAMAGAPVSNMFSAYGGIRWGSGLSRMFQYERTQSRIGATIWENPELYIENSPIFHLPNVTTPLLIMHNDNDGAVPWYQGIELFMGLRRLDKPVWLLNYNGDSHNLVKLPNKRDLSIRMRQFFDYYLLDGPLPLWMKEGVPAINKGIEKGFGTEK
jgi:dipeptidyl aminopeptidase/acylaminoacyl peptidase